LLQLNQFRKHFFNQIIWPVPNPCVAYLLPAELPIPLLLDPLVDVAAEPVIDVPLEPTVGALGATGAVLGAVPPVDVLGGLTPPNGAMLRGIAVGPINSLSAQLLPDVRAQRSRRAAG
jgi:hypothetical protein